MLKIKELRQKNNLTLQQLSAKSGVSASMIGNYENGTSDITLTKLIAIARALEVNFWDLVEINNKITDSTINLSKIEAEISNSLDNLPLDLQNTILKSYLIESKKTIMALQQTKIEKLTDDFISLEEFVFKNVALWSGKSQANEYRERLEKRKNNNKGEQAG